MKTGDSVKVVRFDISSIHFNKIGVIVRHSIMSNKWIVVFPSGEQAPFYENDLLLISSKLKKCIIKFGKTFIWRLAS